MHALNKGFGRNAFFLGAQHDRSAVGVDGAHVMAGVATHPLKPDPNVGLGVPHHVAQMNGAIGVGQGVGNEDFAGRV